MKYKQIRQENIEKMGYISYPVFMRRVREWGIDKAIDTPNQGHGGYTYRRTRKTNIKKIRQESGTNKKYRGFYEKIKKYI